MGKKKIIKYVVVIMESLAGTGHKRVLTKSPDINTFQGIFRDPVVGQDVLYREIKKVKSVKR